MANFLVPNEAEMNTLALLLGVSSPQPWTMHLFINDFTPDEDTVISSFMEADGSNGYAPIDPTWGAIGQDASNRAYTDSDPISFVSTDSPAQDCFGWYLTGPAGELLACERFSDAPRPLGLGATVEFSVRYRLSQEP